MVGVERVHLRSLYLPHRSVDTSKLSCLLSNCPELENLKIRGEPFGSDHIHVTHSKLRILEIECFSPRPLTIHCPNLTRLFTFVRKMPVDGMPGDARTIYLFCPLLIHLRLPKQHSIPAFLEYMASHAPNVEELRFDCCGEDRSNIVTQFKSLRQLAMYNCEDIQPHAFDELPFLDDLMLNAFNRVEAVGPVIVGHQRLRKLCISHFICSSSPELSCPLLEELTLCETYMPEASLEHLNDTCPKLKRLEVDMTDFPGESLTVYHEALEEMKVCDLQCARVRLTCPQLKILDFACDHDTGMVLPNSEADCSHLKHLRITGYNHIRMLPSILKLFPLLETLHIGFMSIDGEELDLVHPHVQDVGLNGLTMRQKLVLSMTSLGHLYVYNSNISELTVASNNSVTLEPTHWAKVPCKGEKKVF